MGISTFRSHHGVDRQQAERGRAVDQDVVEVARRRTLSKARFSRDSRATRGPVRSPRRPGRSWPARTTASARPATGPTAPRAPRPPPARGTIDGLGRVSMPRAVEAFPCGSRSTTSTRLPCLGEAAARFTVVVVLPTPPFWLATLMMRHRSGRGHVSPVRPRALIAARAARAIGVSKSASEVFVDCLGGVSVKRGFT